MNIFKRLFGKKTEKRNYAFAQTVMTESPEYTNWTIDKAVKDGYKASGWVYRCVYLKSKAVASVPFEVRNAENEILPDHHLTKLLKKPNPNISRQDVFELMVMWLDLAGNSYLQKVKAGGKTAELHPFSPDRLTPVKAKDVSTWLLGYALDRAQKPTFQKEEIIHHKYMNPASPLIGISPLEVAGKAVDIDAGQQNFNAQSAANRGVIDGVFTFDREFNNQDDADLVAEKLENRYRQRRGFAVLGSKANYLRTAMTPAEMDYIESRGFNRDEICTIFGVPLALVSADSMTYNNYETSDEMLWSNTIIPLLADIADGFSFAFQDELAEDEFIAPNLSGVPAIQRMMLRKTASAKELFDMGVPFDRLNNMFSFGIEEFSDWGRSYVSSPERAIKQPKTEEKKNAEISGLEKRAKDEKLYDIIEEKNRARFAGLLSRQKKKVFSLIDAEKYDKITDSIKADSDEWINAMSEMYISSAIRFGKNTRIENRGIEIRADEYTLSDEIKDYFETEGFLLDEYSQIEKTTITAILEQIDEGLKLGLSTKDIQQAILDTGIFPIGSDPDANTRALRLARTLSGTANSIGQYTAAKSTGATHKRWEIGGINTRKEHQQRKGESVPIDGRFSPKFGASQGPRYPLDPQLAPADRVNCRCSMTFEIRD